MTICGLEAERKALFMEKRGAAWRREAKSRGKIREK
jgi:hypothetical protein